MALLNILTEGEEALRKVCRPVDRVTDRIRTLLDDMYETMTSAEGVGLAGPQVGVLRRVVVLQVPDGPRYDLINPKIVASEGSQTDQEGCLSIPGEYGIVTRPMKVKARYQDKNGEVREFEAEGLTARAICHECDHLEGKLFKDIAERMLSEEELDEPGESEGDA